MDRKLSKSRTDAGVNVAPVAVQVLPLLDQPDLHQVPEADSPAGRTNRGTLCRGWHGYIPETLWFTSTAVQPQYV
jgi:hypothetical protein